jgi:trimeric autotransporter adhesin
MKLLFAFFGFAIFLLSTGARASGPGDEHWDNQFGSDGANSTLNGIAVSGKNVYVGGMITSAGNLKVNGAAGFDGTNWFPLSSGLMNNQAVVGLGADGNYIYYGGIFTNADDPTAIDTARWDGTNWSGIGINGGIGLVYKRNGGFLYVGGIFTSAGGVDATNIGRWDGTNWFALGPGVNGPNFLGHLPSVTSIAFQGNNVYVGGTFNYAGSLNVTNIAYYDGNVWQTMGNPFNGGVTALTFYGAYLYAGGFFTNSSLGITNLARWDGSSWSGVPGGGANNNVEDFASDGTNLFVGGLFTQIGGIAATGIASFNGSTWSALGSGVHGFQGGVGQVNKMAWQSNQLYVAGSFEIAGNVGTANVARWDGTDWWSLGGGTSKGMSPTLNFVQSLLPIQSSIFVTPGLYAGGLFTGAGSVIVDSIGCWDGTNWNAVGTGFGGTFATGVGINVRALAANNAYLYAGGNFKIAGGNPASGIAYWDGSNWNSLGSGVDWIVNAIAVDNANYIYVGGTFTNAGGIYSRGLAVSAYGTWYNLGNVEGASGAVNSLVFDGVSKIYAGGSFLTAGGVSATNIAYFDNSDFSWHPLGLGLNAKANTVAYGNGHLYAGGSFTKAGALTANHVAQWDGSNWSALGSGITGGNTVIVNSILVVGTDVYVTGNFTNAGGVSATNIAKWNGSTWSALGSGLDLPRAGFALAASGNDLFVGGNFTTAGDKPSEFIARWNDQSNFYPPANMLLTRTVWQTNRQMRFRITGTTGQSYIIQGSTNLASWTPLLTNSIMFFDYADPNSASYPTRFYRTVLGP